MLPEIILPIQIGMGVFRTSRPVIYPSAFLKRGFVPVDLGHCYIYSDFQDATRGLFDAFIEETHIFVEDQLHATPLAY